jgi:cell division septation protein DedD
VLNLLAAFFLMPGNNGITEISSSTEMSASGLALLSEVEVELKIPVAEKVAPITVVESIPVVEEIVSNNGVTSQETLESNESVSALPFITLRNSKPSSKENQAYQCGVFDGIKSIDAANQLKRKLIELQAKNIVISSSEKISSMYWVYLGPYLTKQEAVDANEKLRQRNRSGYFFTNDEVKNSISLGVFSSAVNAQKLQVELNGQGYRSKIWAQSLPLYTLVAEVPSDKALILKIMLDTGYTLTECS